MNVLVLAHLAGLVVAFAEPQLLPSPIAQENPQFVGNKTPESISRQQPRQTENRSNDSPPDWITFLTFVIAMATVVQAYTAWRQARYMQLTRRSFEIGERARLFLDKFVFRGVADAKEKLVIVTYDIVNTGRTAADVYEENSTLLDNFDDEKQMPSSPPYEGGGRPAYYTVGAGQHLASRATFEKSRLPHLAKVADEKRMLYLIGYIKYRDGFQQTHITQYGIKWSISEHSVISRIPNYNVDV